MVGAQLRAARDTRGQLALHPGHEHMIFAVTGKARADGTELAPGRLLYLGPGRDRLDLAAPAGSTALLLGGEPLAQRTAADVVELRRPQAGGHHRGGP